MKINSASLPNNFYSFKKAFASFLALDDEKLADLLNRRDSRGRQSSLLASELLCSLAYHCIHGVGKLSSSLKRMTGIIMSDSGLYKNRQNLSLSFMEQVSQKCFKVISQRATNPESYHQGRLLVGIDGTTYNLRNTQDINAQTTKGTARRSKEEPPTEQAFARVVAVCLVEIGFHNPLAVKVGEHQQSEYELSKALINHLPEKFLLLADRAYGCADFVHELLPQCSDKDGAFVIRVGKGTTRQTPLETLSDGSRIILVPVRSRQRPADIIDHVQVREIHARVRDRKGQWVELRLWTNLLGEKKNPALSLVKLYAKRWEHEIYFGELKNELGHKSLLKSNTLLCALQEIVVGVWATAMIAQVRAAASALNDIPQLQVSFQKTFDKIQTIWNFVGLLGDELPEAIAQKAIEKALEEIKQEATPKRKKRSCPRTVRQNIIPWPKTRQYTCFTGDVHIEIMEI